MSERRLGEPIAAGRTAEVYAWEEGWVLKLFRDGGPTDWVDYEARIARIVYRLGLAVPAVGEVVDVGSRRGILYERVDGESMLDTIMRDLGQVEHYARLLAELHERVAPELPSQRERLQNRIGRAELLTEDVRRAFLESLHALPDGDRLCHGDFHPGNILMTARGPIIIDWVDAVRGNPLADIARTHLLITAGEVPPEAERPRAQFAAAYLDHHPLLTPERREEFRAWHPIVAAARLVEDIAGEQGHLFSIIERGL